MPALRAVFHLAVLRLVSDFRILETRKYSTLKDSMSYITLLTNLGFTADPFATTNADDEEKLDNYFVPPPFFSAVLGDYRKPAASIVFAPRGGGKTALKRKIELDSQSGEYLCLTYNNFDLGSRSLAQIDSEFHQRNIVELVITAVLISVNDRNIDKVSSNEKHLLYFFVKEYFSKIDKERLKANISSIKNATDTLQDLWNRFTGPVGVLFNAVLARFGMSSVEVTKFEQSGGALGSYREQLSTLIGIARTLGYPSIYILIDKVDENHLTASNYESAYAFIRPIIVDLALLETEGLALKIFLWSLISDPFGPEGRPDRINNYTLQWQFTKIEEMLSERLKAFSNGKISALSQLVHGDYPLLSIDSIVAISSQGSPRNMVRICKAILDQQSNIDINTDRIGVVAVNNGFAKIAQEIAMQDYPSNTLRDLPRVGRCDFTTAYVANDIFKITQPAALGKIAGWESSGAVAKVGEIKTDRKNRPSNLYALQSVLLAKHVYRTLSVSEFAAQKIRICSGCNQPLVRDWDRQTEYRCEKCQTEHRT